MKPRIGIFDSSEHVSGISRYVEALLRGLRDAPFDVTLFCRHAGPYQSITGVKRVAIDHTRDGVIDSPAPAAPLVRSALQRGWRKYSPDSVNLLAGFGKSSLRLSKLFTQHQVDLLHVQVVGAEEAAPAAKIAGVKHVIGTLHIDSSQSGLHRWPVEAMTNHCLDRAIAVSQATADDWMRRTALPSRSVVTIPNGVDTAHFSRRQTRDEARRALGLDASSPLLVSVGRLSVQKGYSILIEAIAKLPQVQLAIAGDGPQRESLQALAAARGVTDRVKLLGAMSDVRPLLEAGDVFVMPSLWEAMPYALLEAMAMGCPPIATRVAGVPEVIEHGRNGCLVPAGNVTSLVEAIISILANETVRQEMCVAARERVVRGFDESTMIARTLDVYRQSLMKVSRRRGMAVPFR